jgi:hypothetical protein
MIDLNTRDYGDVAPLVKAISGLLSAAWAVYFGFRGRNKEWEPPTQPLSSSLSRVAAVAVAAGLAYVWYQLTDPSEAVRLIKLLSPSVILTVTAFLLYGLQLKLLVHTRKFSTAPNVMSAEKVVGGFWKSKEANEAQRKSDVYLPADKLIWSMENDPDLVWPPFSRGLAQLSLNLSYVFLTATGASLLTCGGATIIAAQLPRIQEFTVSPAQVKSKEVLTISWRVVNARSVNLDPIGGVPAIGNRAERPEKATAYTLTAKNSFGETGVQQGVDVSPVVVVKSGSSRRQAVPPSSNPITGSDIALEARECVLVENVVIRGEGWLQNEHSGIADAECTVKLANAGNYEIFVNYSSPESRPIRIALNTKIIAENGLASPTGGAGEMNRVDQSLGVFPAVRGANTIQFYSEHPFPNVRQIRFRPR